ncbi:hypothetical protein GHT06_019803 [Daphnia sinensis]|uniref:Peroxidase-like n=1 Tax=Daphnia sinensis TaxID=1820382 RepID=A0AAD5L1I0_9CRUS|nr:hypothetical protein GHT06_019803 [Daphnia sinensis]
MAKVLCLFVIVQTLVFTFAISDEIAVEDLHDAVNQGVAQVESMLELERQLLAKGLTVDRGTSAHLHSLMVAGSEQQHNTALNAARILAASTRLKNKLNWSADEARRALPLLSLDNTLLKNSCPESITCPPADSIKYRTIDGSCNNQARPDWGKANTPFQRALPDAYADGVFEPRNSSGPAPLKSPRVISTTFIKPGVTTANDFTLMLMTWGQFITHDITKASSFTSADGKTPQCCNVTSGQPLAPEYLHPFCLPIDIPANDGFYQQYGQTCMTFVRTQIGADYSCSLGHAEQLNAITHWLDGSMVYGSSSSELDSLRLGRGGELKNSTTEDGMELLPLRPSCSDATCYYAGDVRAQENPQLAIVHTLMMREHNRIARALAQLNPLWSDEVIFQETRRIVIAQLQHITYTEYLPAMLVNSSRSGNVRSIRCSDCWRSVYMERIRSRCLPRWSFSSAGIFSVIGYSYLYDSNDVAVQDQSFTLSNYFFDASKLPEPGFIDNAIRGLTKQMPLAINPEYTSQLTNYLFKGSKAYGMDLVAINVQRGREHGIPDYNTVREFCGLPKATNFEDLDNEIEQTTINSLKAAYDSVNDIDLYIGCLAESSRPVNGSLLGPTGLCIVARQFAVTKNNDRFFYDVGNQPGSLTMGQLNEIRKTSLARILCDNNNGDVNTMQPKAFRAPVATSNNERQQCSSMPSIDLSLWKDPKATPSKASMVLPSILAVLFSVFLLV